MLGVRPRPAAAPGRAGRSLTDLAIGTIAAATVAGAWLAIPAPWPATGVLGGLVLIGGWRCRTVTWMALACFALATAAGARAWAGSAPLPAAPFHGLVTLRTDPGPLGPGVVAEVVSAGRHLEVKAFGGSARRLRPRLAGQQLVLAGRLSPPTGATADWLRSRHIVGVVEVTSVSFAGDGSALARSANRARQVLDRGARTMDPRDRSLYLGFVIGDDRAQSEAMIAAFRAAGLSHLTAVSGQNVALLLAVAGPGLRRLRHTTRWAVTLALIGWFALLTRFEPSVIRASVMAALVASAVVAGRRAAPARILGLTVTMVLLVDPLLVHSVGWWLSVGATTGIALAGPPLALRLPGPQAVRTALAVTIGAQLGVAPVSIAVFGPLPLASVPANLMAAPLAGPVMIYGLPAGVLAAGAPDGLAWLIQLPTVLLVRAIAGIASSASSWPLPGLGLPAVLAAGLGVALLLRRPPRHRR
jgi:competence protein ComEC